MYKGNYASHQRPKVFEIKVLRKVFKQKREREREE
jgi:hypothetical protein